MSATAGRSRERDAFSEGLGAFGQRALNAFGVRLAVLFLGTALIAVPLTAGDWTRIDQVTDWVLAAFAGGVAVSRGPRWGLFVLLAASTAALTVESLLGGPATPLILLGPLSYCLGGGGTHLAARRGFRTTERTITASAQTLAAQQVIEERWRSGRQESRRLHDTVLATLTVLSHQGAGLAEEQIRRACVRDLEILGGDSPTPQTGSVPTLVPVTDPDQDGRPDDDDDGSAGQVLARALDLASTLGLQTRVHGVEALQSRAFRTKVSGAVHDALAECLRNVSRHSGVSIVDIAISCTAEHAVLVVVDEGRGFDVDAISPDRLGLLASVRERIADVGGSVTIWARPGQGASVIIRAPLVPAETRPGPGGGNPADLR